MAVSRRRFMSKAMAGAGATAATALGTNASVSAEDAAATHKIKIPDEFARAASTAAAKAEFPMTGAQVFARVCKEEGLAALFSCPGNYNIVNAIAQEGIPTYSGRHEGSMCHAADGFCRVTGEVAAASGTEGPGFTDMINAIAAANAARSPVLVLASNMTIRNEDTEAGIQLGYQQPTTEGLKKYGKRLITPAACTSTAPMLFASCARAFRVLFISIFRRSLSRAVQDRGRSGLLLRQGRIPHASPNRIRDPKTCRGGRSSQTGAAADHRFEQRRLLQPRLGRAQETGRESADSGR